MAYIVILSIIILSLWVIDSCNLQDVKTSINGVQLTSWGYLTRLLKGEFGPNGRYVIQTAILFLIFYLLKDDLKLPDVDDYFAFFKHIGNVSLSSLIKNGNSVTLYSFDIGWCFYNKLLSFVSNDTFVLVFSNSIILVFVYFTFIGKYSRIPVVSILIFLFSHFYMSCFIMRQFIAISLCLLSIPHILNRNLIKFTITVLLACTFHKTAVVFFVPYFLYNVPLSKKYFIIIIGVFLILTFNKFVIRDNAILLLGISDVYYDVNEANGSDGGNYTSFAINCAILLFVFVFTKFKGFDGINKLMLDCLILSTMLLFIAIGMDGTMGRLNLYYNIANMILIPYTLAEIKNSSLRIVMSFVILALYFYMFANSFSSDFQLLI